jgi:hypothetical protein
MDSITLIFMASGAALAAGILCIHQNIKERKLIMAAIDHLNTAISNATASLEGIRAGVDRVAGLLSAGTEAKVEQAALNVDVLSAALVEVRDRLDTLAPKPVEPPAPEPTPAPAPLTP